VNLSALNHYLSVGYIPGDLCIIDNVKKLPPAHALVYNLDTNEIKSWRYWGMPELVNSGNGLGLDENDLLDELEILLENAVCRQLVADVPVGVLLSGGVDSSLITAMAVRSSPKVKTFTIRFPGYGKYDESGHARLVSEYFDTEHYELDAVASTVSLLPILARQFDEPMADSSMIPTYLVSRMIREYCTVALGGDGGDELFGGYIRYSQQLNIQNKSRVIPKSLRVLLADRAEKLIPVGVRGRSWLQSLNYDLKTSFLPSRLFDSTTRKRLLDKAYLRINDIDTIYQHDAQMVGDVLQRMTRIDFKHYLPEDILVKVDRTSMLNSLEVRAPFLDYRVIEFAFGKVPSSLKATSTSRKILLKKLAARVLPKEFDNQRKQGFSIPLSQWLQDSAWSRYFQEILLDSSDSPFDRNTVIKLLQGQAKGRSNNERLFALVLFELWRKEYSIDVC